MNCVLLVMAPVLTLLSRWLEESAASADDHDVRVDGDFLGRPGFGRHPRRKAAERRLASRFRQRVFDGGHDGPACVRRPGDDVDAGALVLHDLRGNRRQGAVAQIERLPLLRDGDGVDGAFAEHDLDDHVAVVPVDGLAVGSGRQRGRRRGGVGRPKGLGVSPCLGDAVGDCRDDGVARER